MLRFLLFSILLIGAACSQSIDSEPQPIKVNHIDTTQTKETAVLAVDDSLNRLTDYIAGLSEDSLLTHQIFHQAYTEFHNKFDQRWKKFQQERIRPVQDFARQNLDTLLPTFETVLYPFSGPDALYPLMFFPNKKRYVLIGLEPVGSLPTFQNDSMSSYYHQLYHALNAILQFSFFRTESMEEDLHNDDVNGTIHVLSLFLRRMDHHIISMQRFEMDTLGQKVYTSIYTPAPEKTVQGLEIVFKNKQNQVQMLDYVSANIADYAMRNKKALQNFLKAVDKPITYLKGASYLLHKPTFKSLRTYIIEQSVAIVQDDSGIPVQYLPHPAWQLHLFGSYSKPISMFAKHFQSDLDSLYKNGNPQKLQFGLGYNYRDKNSCLIVAVKK